MSVPDPKFDEFAHIDGAIQALTEIFNDPICNSTSKHALAPLFSALDFVIAKPLSKIKWIDNKYADPSDILDILCGGNPIYQKRVTDIIQANISDRDESFPTPIHPLAFYHRATFRRTSDNQNLRAQYLHPCGLGVVLQLGSRYQIHSPSSLSLKHSGQKRPFWERMDGWMLVSVFAGESVEDGPEPIKDPAYVQAEIDKRRAEAVQFRTARRKGQAAKAQAMRRREDEARRVEEAKKRMENVDQVQKYGAGVRRRDNGTRVRCVSTASRVYPDHLFPFVQSDDESEEITMLAKK